MHRVALPEVSTGVRLTKREVDTVTSTRIPYLKIRTPLPYDRATIEARHNAMINSSFNNIASTCPLCVTLEIELHLAPAFQLVAKGSAFRLFAHTLNHLFTLKSFGQIRVMAMQREMYGRNHVEAVR